MRQRKASRPQSAKAAYIVILCILLLNFVGNYPQYQLSPLAYLLMPEMGMTAAQFSGVFSAAMIPGILLSFVAGLLCDKLGAKMCIGIAAAISAATVCLRVVAPTYSTLFACMFVSGIVATFVNANIPKIVGGWFRTEKVGAMVGLCYAGSTAAMAVAMGTTAMLPSVRTAYVLAAAGSVAATLVWFLFMREKRVDAGPDTTGAPAQVSLAECLKVVLKNRNVWLVSICLGLVLAANMCLSTFMSQALQSSRGVDAAAAGAMASAVMFGNLFGSVFGPALCAKLRWMKLYLFLFCLIGGVGTAFAWTAPVGPLLTVALFLTGFVCSGAISQFVSIPVMLSEIGPAYAGTAGGVTSTIQLLFGVVLPSYIIAPLVGSNYALLFVIAGLLLVVACGIVLGLPELLRRKQHGPAIKQAV